jgi:hypothetical protein
MGNAGGDERRQLGRGGTGQRGRSSTSAGDERRRPGRGRATNPEVSSGRDGRGRLTPAGAGTAGQRKRVWPVRDLEQLYFRWPERGRRKYNA